MDLYIDGNIAQMAGPEDAARYFILPRRPFVLPLLSTEGRSITPSLTPAPSFRSACGLRETLRTLSATLAYR